MWIWDVVCSTADTLKKQLPDPEPVNRAGRAAYSVVAVGAPDLKTPIAGILQSSYDHSRSALCSVAAQAGRVESIYEAVKVSMPDKEGWVRIGWNLTDLGLDKYSRMYTGGLPVYKIVMEGLVVKKDHVNVESAAAATQAHDIKIKQELQEMRNRLDLVEAMLLAKGGSHPIPPHRMHQKLEDVVRVFMMKGFTGGDFVNHQVVQQHENRQSKHAHRPDKQV